ncbi:MAG: hypothetical protein IJO76_02365 [Clostridia bacterium]|nr:hypothetical protein [Clostridia bacterium]
MQYITDGLWGMALGAAMLLYGLCRLQSDSTGRRRRRVRLCLTGGGCLFVLGVLFVCCPQPWGAPLIWLWSGGTAVVLVAHEWLSPE